MAFDFKGPPSAGAFSRAFTIFLTPQCRSFSRALISEKSKSPLFPGSGGGGAWLQITSALQACNMIMRTPLAKFYHCSCCRTTLE